MNIFRIGYPQTLQSVSNRSYFSLVFSLNASQTNGVPYLASGIIFISLLVFIHVYSIIIKYDIKSKIISSTVNKVGSEKLLAGKSCFM